MKRKLSFLLITTFIIGVCTEIVFGSSLEIVKVNPARIITSLTGDVNGDKHPDAVYLRGIGFSQEGYKDITLNVVDGKTKKTTTIDLSENMGYMPYLFLGDFTGDKNEDILIKIDSGGSGGFVYGYIYSFVVNKPVLLISTEEINNKYTYTVNYKDNYNVEVISNALKTVYLVNIEYKGAEYLSEIYDQDGKLKKNIEGFSIPVSEFTPIGSNDNGRYSLFVIQGIAGQYDADRVCSEESIFDFEKDKFVLSQQYTRIVGQELE